MSYELKVLVIIKALKKFRVYCWEFKVITNYRAFMATINKKDLCMHITQ